MNIKNILPIIFLNFLSFFSHASESIVIRGQRISRSLPASPALGSRASKSQVPDILSGPYDEFWYDHCLQPRLRNASEKAFTASLILDTSHGPLNTDPLLTATFSKDPNSHFMMMKNIQYSDLLTSDYILPALYARLIDILRNRSSHFMVKKDIAANFTRFGALSAISDLPYIELDYVFFTVDHAKKKSSLLQHGILQRTNWR